jgi:hypothetical protein
MPFAKRREPAIQPDTNHHHNRKEHLPEGRMSDAGGRMPSVAAFGLDESVVISRELVA